MVVAGSKTGGDSAKIHGVCDEVEVVGALVALWVHGREEDGGIHALGKPRLQALALEEQSAFERLRHVCRHALLLFSCRPANIPHRLANLRALYLRWGRRWRRLVAKQHLLVLLVLGGLGLRRTVS